MINVQVQGQHPYQWAPFQTAGFCMHGRSHTRSPGMSIMRVDSRELPLSAIPLCQLLPCHLGPPRPTLSINLYVKGCLYCTIGAFHMSIPSAIWLKSDVYFVIYSNIWQASMRGHLWWPYLEPIKFRLSEFWKRLRHAHCSVVANDNWRMNQDGDTQEIVFLKRCLRYLCGFSSIQKQKNERLIREINETFK